ncbi:MAG TPA: UDP-N-acetylmuramoyl-tripeptide--D-alanyl-D-alanine ligase [Thermomicrobiales bacterium]|nr:UDP-N-acetylmuramoyl-tripeptide--D-alanyl-D-alanine ligase [Thermomicrobiales bacterium]
MMSYTLQEVLDGTGGTLRGDLDAGFRFRDIVRDSRTVAAGDLYWAIQGERLAGHQFVGEAVRAAAAAAVVSRESLEEVPEAFPLIVVDNTIVALQRLAAWKRNLMHADVIGITGSVGKTSAKESIAAVLAEGGKVYRSGGNYNNEIGLPLSILEAPLDVDFLVLEMGGAYAFGEITHLSEIARPRVGVVTNVYPVHIERMGTIEAIAETKAELVDAIPEDGVAILNGDDHRVRAMAERAKGRVVTYGLGEDVDVRASDVQSDGLKGTSFWLQIDGQRHHIRVPLVGAHGVQIALVALATGHAYGMHIAAMLVGLRNPGVQVRLVFERGPGGSQIIDDTYNASTPSVLAALDVLRDVPGQRHVAVLGEMRELGDVSEEEHRVVGRRAGDLVDLLFTYGELADPLAEAAQTVRREDRLPLEVRSFPIAEKAALIEALEGELHGGDVVLIKGSRGLEMEEVVAALRRRSEDVQETGE